MNSLLDILTYNKIKLHLVSKGDKYCEANGEDKYINSSYSDIDNIWLGIFDTPELQTISFCHEIAHCIVEKTIEFENPYDLEEFVWKTTFDIAKECDITFTENTIRWGQEQLETYKNN